MDIQQQLPTMEWPALIVGPVFLSFELRGVPGHKGRHRSRIVFPKNGKAFIHNYPDPETEAYEKTMAEAGALFMRGKAMTENPVALLVTSYRPIPKSWTLTEKAQAIAGYIRPTTKPDWDNHGKITDALNGIVWKDDSQVVDGRSIKHYSDTPALRVEVREFLPPDVVKRLSP